MNKAVFLDRDGVLNKERGDYTYLISDFEINEGVFEALKRFRDHGYMLIVITNQGGIAKGIYSVADVEKLNIHLINLMKEKGIIIDEIYFCPHHPDHGKCLCRKPDSLLIEKAAAKFNISLEKSFFIGDADRDVVAGNKAGLKTIKVEPNSNLLNITALIK